MSKKIYISGEMGQVNQPVPGESKAAVIAGMETYYRQWARTD